MTRSSISMQKINMIMNRTNEVYHEAAVRLGLSDSSMWILYALAQYGSLTQAQICTMCGISKQTIHSSVSKLIKQGILQMEAVSRNAALQLTPKGEQLVQDKIAKLIDVENDVMNQWTQKEQEQFIRFNEEYFERLKEGVLNL